MALITTIVFGPTGNVGSVVACAAQEHGAKVVLALRDTSKPIPGLTPEQEKTGGFERVQADLTDLTSVKEAVTKTGAKRAFIYRARTTQDNMRGCIETLKAGGVDFIVFLSSATIVYEKRSVPPDTLIPFLHAQVEVALEEVMGPEGYIAVRPGFFATNAQRWTADIHKGEIQLEYPDGEYDWITPEDMGKVSAAALVRGIEATEGEEDRNIIYTFGPKFLSLRDGVELIAKALGKDVKITEMGEEEAVRAYIRRGMPEPVARDVLGELKMRFNGEGVGIYDPTRYAKGVANVRKYAGSNTGFGEWVEKHRDLFQI
ncbi:NAD(P)-binding protein [Thozetella sp. PMI_491]|nr:NAD(P)-binding protein [Thozetella sp. PMI_491]